MTGRLCALMRPNQRSFLSEEPDYGVQVFEEDMFRHSATRGLQSLLCKARQTSILFWRLGTAFGDSNVVQYGILFFTLFLAELFGGWGFVVCVLVLISRVHTILTLSRRPSLARTNLSLHPLRLAHNFAATSTFFTFLFSSLCFGSTSKNSASALANTSSPPSPPSTTPCIHSFLPLLRPSTHVCARTVPGTATGLL